MTTFLSESSQIESFLIETFPNVIIQIVCDYVFPFTSKLLSTSCSYLSVIDTTETKICVMDKEINDSIDILTLDKDSQIIHTQNIVINHCVDCCLILPGIRPIIVIAINRGRVLQIDPNEMLNITQQLSKYAYDSKMKVQCLASLQFNDSSIIASGINDKINLWKLCNDKSVINLFEFKIDCGPGFASGVTDDRSIPVQCITELPGRNGTPDRFVTGSLNGWIKVWELDLDNKTSQCMHFSNIGSKINCLIYMDLGKTKTQFLISGSHDGIIRIYDTGTFSCQSMMRGHTDSVNRICILNNHQICSGSDDGTIKIWNIETKECLNTIGNTIKKNKYKYVGCLPGGRIISLSKNRFVEVWSR
jgi:WD40 repeat protein